MPLRIFLLASLFALMVKYVGAQPVYERAVILEATELTIRGNTNVSTFNCSMKKTNLCDTIALIGRQVNEYSVFSGLEIDFEVADFDCGIMLMTRDFRELLKFEDYPHIRLRIDDIRPEEGTKSEFGGSVSAMVTLFIAGTPGIENIQDATVHRIRKKVILTGSHQVLMTRFKIEPPTKMFGAVRTEDQLEIDFAIQIE